MFDLVVIGSSHRLVPPSKLEELSRDRDQISARLVRARREGTCKGGVLIATCNRVEVILHVERGRSVDPFELALGRRPDLPMQELSGLEAVEHLLAVAAGLESMVVGEEQIIGQVNRAFRSAQELGILSRKLTMLWSRLLASARAVRHQCEPCGRRRSVAELAAALAHEAGPAVAVVGAGATGQNAAETLMRLGAGELWVVNRTAARAEQLASHCGGRAMTLADFLVAPPDVDAVVCAVRHCSLAFAVDRMPRLRRVLDIGHPSVLDEATRDHPRLEVIDLDRLAAVARAEAAELDQWVATARLLVAGRAGPVFADLRQDRANLGNLVQLHVDAARAEAERACRGRLRELTSDAKDEVLRLVERVARRNAHLHIKDLGQLVGS